MIGAQEISQPTHVIARQAGVELPRRETTSEDATSKNGIARTGSQLIIRTAPSTSYRAVRLIQRVELIPFDRARPFSALRPEIIKDLIVVENAIYIPGPSQRHRIVVQLNDRIVRNVLPRVTSAKAPNKPLRIRQAQLLQNGGQGE